jgi:hypothetical protein
VVYAYLADGRDEKQLIELDAALAPTPEIAQEAIDRQNMEAMKELQSMMSAGPRRGR